MNIKNLGKVIKSPWQIEIDQWREDVDKERSLMIAALNDRDARIEELEERLLHTNRQVMKLMKIKT